jgi:hypothetical protein
MVTLADARLALLDMALLDMALLDMEELLDMVLLDADDGDPFAPRSAWLLGQLRQVGRIARQQQDGPWLTECHGGQ